MATLQFAAAFQRRLKKLAKRYRQIQKDIEPILTELQADNFIGDQIPGTTATVFKVRAKIAIFLQAKVVDIV